MYGEENLAQTSLKWSSSRSAIDEVLECNSRALWLQLGKDNGKVLKMKRNDEASKARSCPSQVFKEKLKMQKCQIERE